MRAQRHRGSASGRRRLGLAAAAMVVGSATLTACGSDDDGRAVLNWYINPDAQETVQQIAEDCSTDDYSIEVQLLPNNATEQRTQLARRLAAKDSSTDLMNLDPIFVPEFASAGWLEPFTGEMADQVLDDDVLEGAALTATWEDEVVVAPQWANTQVLWFRKSLAEKAGLDMSKPVTWSQIIEAASDNGATVGVQANKYEGYTVWLNALVMGAGGELVSNTEAGKDAKIEIDSEAGRAAAEVIQQLVDSDAAMGDLSVSNEGTVLGPMFAEDSPGTFMVNWTFAYKNYEDTAGDQLDDLGWARYPATVEGEESRPPIGGIQVGVGAYSENKEHAQEAALCVTSPEAQEALAVNNGLFPSRGSVYEAQGLVEAYPEELLALFRESIDGAGPRPQSAFYSQISSAIQSTWHAPSSVDPESTPQESAEFLSDVLGGRRLL
ncbi:extracellular solute-binding protein [Nocardioides sp. Y6]|uniref:Extracellular solute-binding protein n=1 Tax=Nocardioides malaquae TaxID=2773426 RepID=A0ABR9RQR7_9ACTN|nr:extracellular solute-binding protein [Nocardioides malaquae]MBE7323901.1 extracellular solute-binding protein [Nocardioides malaquae]